MRMGYLVVLAFLVAALPSQLQAQGWYPLYASYGYGEGEPKDLMPASDDFTADEEHDVKDFLIGLPLSEDFSLEFGYVELGETRLVNDSTGVLIRSYDDKTLALNAGSVFREDATGLTAGLRYAYPLHPNFDIYTRLGVIHWETELSAEGTVALNGTALSNGQQDNGTAGYLALGLRYNLSQTVGIGMEYTRYDEVAGREIDAIFTRLDIKFDTLPPTPQVR
ncbi:MAG: outer membrane beta-barrel protein [Parvibaculales bacterium]